MVKTVWMQACCGAVRLLLGFSGKVRLLRLPMYIGKINKFRLQWGVLLVGLVLLAGAVIHNLYRNYEDILEAEQQRLLTQARVIAVNVANRLESTDKVLRLIRRELQAYPEKSWARQVPHQRFELMVNALSGVHSMLVLDARGRVVVSNRQELLGSDLGQRPYFQAALRDPAPDKLFVTPPFKTLPGTWGIALVRVILNSQGKFSGVVEATLNPEYFKVLLGSVQYAPDMWSALAHGDGLQFIMEPDRPGQQGMNLAKPGSFFTRHMQSGKKENVLSGTVYSTKEKRLMALSTVQPTTLSMDKPLIVAVSRDLAQLHAGWRKHAINQAITFSIITALSISALIAFQRYQREQLVKSRAAEQALLDARQQLNDIIDFFPDAVFVIDKEKRVTIWNRAIEKMTGVAKEDMLGKGDYEYTIPFYGQRRTQLLDLLDLDDAELVAKYSNVRRVGEVLDAETFCPSLNEGTGAYVWATGVPLYNAAGERIGAIEAIRDISARKEAEAYLKKLTHGIENSASAVMITDKQGIIEYVNRKFCQLTGYRRDEAIGQNPRILKSEATHPEVFADLWKTILSGREWRGELLNRRKTGEVYWSIASISPLRDDSGEISHFIANVEDINERKNAEATIEHLAYFDPLTDLPNRRMLQDRLELALRRSRRQGSNVALMYLDLDSFKHVNDSMGHPAGDLLLKEMAGRFSGVLRDDDVVCRLGGDEFAMILHDIRQDQDVVPVAQKLIEVVALPVPLDGREVVVTASIGIALFPRDGGDVRTLEKHADIALYHAKEEGKNTFRFFLEELNSTISTRIALEQGLRHALERRELELYYQPKVSVSSGEVSGVEALLRWNSPDFGLVSPIRFIPLAEQTRLIIPIGEWVLRTACLQQVQWQEQGLHLSMAVNLSAIQLKSPGLVERIAAIIDETGILPEQLELELTESALVNNPDEVVQLLERLRSLGCSISIDDFGTGYSSLSYLKSFPVTILKIDRSFVRDLAHNSGDRAIAQSVVDLANNLDMQTVAEGVETDEQLAILQQIGCTYIQGFIYSRPVPAANVPGVVGSLKKSV